MIGAIILGIVAGAVGRFLMPGENTRMGFLATTALGLAGAVVGWLLFTALLGIGDRNMFDLGGLLSAIIGVVIVLGMMRLLVGHKWHRPRPFGGHKWRHHGPGM